jgi:hypothetical protein
MKPAFPPLLAPGRHVMNIASFEALTVHAFPNSTTRSALYAEFQKLFYDIGSRNFPCEIWLNGSFLTHKIDPQDIDLTVIAHVYALESLDLAHRNFFLDTLNGGKSYSRVLDTYRIIQFNMDDVRSRSFRQDDFAKLWGSDWEGFLKGFVVIKIGENDVWFRLFT